MSSAMANRIIVVCAHESGGRARITALNNDVLVEYGYFDSQGLFCAVETEKLPYLVYPELLGIFQEDAWDAIILAALVDTFCED